MRLFFYFFTILSFVGCNHTKEQQLTQASDYDKYLNTTQPSVTSKYFELWNNKIKPDSMQLTSFGIVAGEYNRFFQNTGDIKYLKMAEKALKRAVKIAAIGKAGYLRALARNYIAQHRFKEALELARLARNMGGDLLESRYLLFDVHMELGNYARAEKYLDSVKNMSDFGYLIRLSKWNDHQGDLQTTIHFMEKAKQKVETSKNKDLRIWTYTNLADYYGHAGRIKESYEHYLKALELDSKNAYAKKGIAWIVFSYEKKPHAALNILQAVTKTYRAPEYDLLKAQIAEFIGDDQSRLNYLDNYHKAVGDPRYGLMYNIPNAELYLDHTQEQDRGLQLAKDEIKNRSTPETYGVLAYAYLRNGEKDRAVEIVERQILGKTHEPSVLFYAAEIYKSRGETKKLAELRSELLEAAYELGPVVEAKIREF